MDISGLSSNTGYYAAAPSMSLHSTACSCATCQGDATSASGLKNATQNPPAVASSSEKSSSSTISNLSDEALAQVRQLQASDRHVRQHEQAHLAASGGLASSGASYTYQKGPDGISYAIGGEVNIDVSAGKTPEDTIARAKTIQAAAMAPADPSGPDRAVAAQARQMEQEARNALEQQKTDIPNKDNKIQTRLNHIYGAIAKAGGASSGHINTYA